MNDETLTAAKVISGLLTLDDAAALLGISVIGVRRLIAKSLLPATLIGEADQTAGWRVIGADLAAYIKGGAAQFTMPKIEGNWFARVPGAATFPDAIVAACQDQIPEQAPAVSEGQAVQLRVTLAVNAVCLSRPRAGLAFVEDDSLPDWRCCYLMDLLHIMARGIAESSKPMQEPLAALYQSPERFRQVLAAATERMLEGYIGFSKQYLITSPNGHKEWGVIHFQLAHKLLVDAGGVTLRHVQTLAF
jgi:hypothetical protein